MTLAETAVVPGSGEDERWLSAHDLVQTQLCSRSSCDEELEPGAPAGSICAHCRSATRSEPTAQRRGAKQRKRPTGNEPAATTHAEEPVADADPAEKPAHTCQTPGCESRASSRWGRFSFCVPCQIARGTRDATGKLILRNPKSPGSHERKKAGLRRRDEVAGPIEAAVLELLDVARRVDLALDAVAAAGGEADAAFEAWRAALEKAEAVGKGRSVGEPWIPAVASVR